MPRPAHVPRRDAPKLTSLVTIDDDRKVAHVEVGPWKIGSLWIVGCQTGKPTVSWPRTSRGYPIVEVAEPLKSEIEALVLAGEQEATPDLPPPPRRPRRRRAKPKPRAADHGADRSLPDDPLVDLFRA